MALTAAELQELLDALNQANADAEQLADSLEDAIQQALVRAQGHAAERIGNILAHAPDFNELTTKRRLEWWIQHKNAIEDALRGSGYSSAITAYVNDLPQFVSIVQATQVALEKRFIEFPTSTIDFLKRRQLEQFTALGNRANVALQDLLYGQVFGGAKKKVLLPQIKSTITGTYSWGNTQGMYEWHAGTYARTNHFKFLAELDAAQADAHGLTENFIYLGPVDEKTRPFCRKLLANPRAYTKDEIQKLDNGFRTTHPEVADCLTCRGGFNCRHRWLAVTPGLAAKLNAGAKVSSADPSKTPVDVSTAASKWKEQKTVADAEAWARDNGLASDTVNYDTLHKQFVNKLNRELAILVREFPDATPMFLGAQARGRDWLAERGIFPKRPPSNFGGFYDKVKDGTQYTIITFPAAQWGSPAAIRTSLDGLRKQITSGFMSSIPGENDPLQRLIFHEFGHAMDAVKGIEQGAAVKELLAGWESKYGPQFRLKYILPELCQYSAMHKWELFSEGFVEYILSPNPRKPAREIGEIMMRAHGRPLRKL